MGWDRKNGSRAGRSARWRRASVRRARRRVPDLSGCFALAQRSDRTMPRYLSACIFGAALLAPGALGVIGALINRRGAGACELFCGDPTVGFLVGTAGMLLGGTLLTLGIFMLCRLLHTPETPLLTDGERVMFFTRGGWYSLPIVDIDRLTVIPHSRGGRDGTLVLHCRGGRRYLCDIRSVGIVAARLDKLRDK